MKPVNEPVHAFVVRIWVEPREKKNAEPIWRGVIEHVASDECMYFDHLDEMNAYFAKYLQQIGINADISEE